MEIIKIVLCFIWIFTIDKINSDESNYTSEQYTTSKKSWSSLRNQAKKNLSLSSLIFQGEQIYENKNDKRIINFESANDEKKISKRCLALSRKSKANDNDNDNNINNTKSRVAKDIKNKVKLIKYSKPNKLKKDIKIKKDKSHDIDKPRQKKINKKHLTKSTKASANNNNDDGDDDDDGPIKKKPKKPKLPEYRCTCIQICDDDTNENKDLNKEKNPPIFGPSILKMAKNISSSSSRAAVVYDKSIESVLLSCPVNATYLDKDGKPLPREQNVKNRSKCRFLMIPCRSPYYNTIQDALKPQNNENLSTTTTPSTSTTLHANYPPNFPAYYPPNYPQNYPASNYQQNPQQPRPPPPSSSTTPASFYIIGKSSHNKNYQHDQSYPQQENNNEESITTSINQDDNYSENMEKDENNEDNDETHQEASVENYSEEIKNYHYINNNNIINRFEQFRKNKKNKRVSPETIGNEHLNELKDLTGLNHQDVILLRSSIYQAIYKLSTSIVDNNESKLNIETCDKVKTLESESVQGLGDLPIIQELFNIPAIKNMLINTVKNIILKLTGVSKCSSLGKLTNNKIAKAIKIVIGGENLPELSKKSQWSLTNDNSRHSISEIIVEYLKKINEDINSKDSNFIKPGVRNIIFNFLINLIYRTKNVVENALKWKELDNDFNEDKDDKYYFLSSREKNSPTGYYSSENEQLECKKKYRSIDLPIDDNKKKQLDELIHSNEEKKINSKTDESNGNVTIIPEDDFATKYQLSLNFQYENEDDKKSQFLSTSFDDCLDNKNNAYIKELMKIHGVSNDLKKQDKINNPLINHMRRNAEKRLYKNIIKYKKKCDNLIDERKNMIEKILKWLKNITINSNTKK